MPALHAGGRGFKSPPVHIHLRWPVRFFELHLKALIWRRDAASFTLVSGTDTPSHANALEASSLSKSFGTVRAVNALTFTLKEGEILGLLGPNGSGKTTTMKM